MTTQEKTKAIAEAIQKACPDLMELRFGCKIQRDSGAIERILYVSTNTNGSGYSYKTHNSTFFDNNAPVKWQWVDSDGAYWAKRNGGENCLVLGSPITISHILRTFNFFAGEVLSHSLQKYRKIEILDRYNLKQDTLEAQSPDFIDFLYSFLE